MNTEIAPPLAEDEIDWLDEFLLNRLDVETSDAIAAAGGDEGIIGMSELDGFLTAIVSGPNVIMPSTWLPALWGDTEPEWESNEQFEKVFQLIMRHHNGIAFNLMSGSEHFGPLFNEAEADGDTVTFVDEWCVGYMRGVALDEDAWLAGGREVEELLSPIELWVTPEGLEKIEKMDDDDVVDAPDAIVDSMRALHKYWLDRRTARPTSGRSGPKRRPQ